jgi:putative spermidine/putrescine transport system substrate-binding protein
VWDVVDVTIEFLYTSAKDGLEKIGPTATHAERIKPEFRHERGLGDIVWSYNIAYSPSASPDGKGHKDRIL